MSLLPAVVAVLLALVTQKSSRALFIAAAVGALVSHAWNPLPSLMALSEFGLNAVGLHLDKTGVWAMDTSHIKIMAFSLLVAATVNLLGEAGSTRALVGKMAGVASGPRGAMITSWLAGWVIFFDDYANCLVVGNTMRPLTDRVGVSRAKLAYIVDSTAAPVASLALVSTWVGYEIGLINDGLGVLAATTSGLEVYISSIPYRFYALFTLFFVGVVAFTQRDFGPMLQEEERARANTQVQSEIPDTQGNWVVAVVTIGLLLTVTMGDLYRQGLANLPPDNLSPALFEILGAADAFDAMLRGAIVGYAVAVMTTIRRIGRSKLFTTTWKAMWVVCEALLVLIFAWMLGSAITACGASAYLQTLLTGNMSPEVLPAATFLLAAIIAFSTGTSWGTMSILFPIALPLAITMTGDVGAVTLATTSAILAGACFGDHASPISDTTILSALGAEVDLITHVRTQLPYALTTGTIALFLGYLPAGYGVSPWILIPIGAFAAWVVMRTFGKRPSGAQMREPVDERVG